MYNIKNPFCYLIIAVVTLIVFFNTFQNEFVFDDESVVQNNESITTLSNIPKYFTGEEGFHKVIGKYYRPVVSATYAIDYALYGLTPKGFHVTNVIVHLIASLLLFKVLLLLFSKSKYANFIALLGALLFVVHPIHTEAVSWVSGRTDSIVTLFFFASFLYYIKFSDSDNNNSKFLILSVIFYFIGLLSKEMIVTMPVIIVLYDFIYKKKPFSYFAQNIKTYLLFAAVTIIYFIIRYFALKGVPDRLNYMYFVGKDEAVVFFTMLKTIPLYFKLLFWPVNLLYHYNGYLPDSNSLDGNVILSIVFLIVVVAAAVFFYKGDSRISFVILFFLVSLAPVMNIIPTMNFMAERFLYLTSFALSVLLCIVLVKYINEKNKGVFALVCVVILLAFSYLTIKRNAEWKTNDILYSTADGIDGNVLLVNAGNIYANSKRYDEAAARYRKAIEIRDNSVLAHHNLGLIHYIHGNLDSAEIEFKKGIAIDSLAPDGYLQLANIMQMKGNKTEAINSLEKLQTIIPNYKDSKSMLEAMRMQQQFPDSTGKIPDNALNNLPGNTPGVDQAKLQLLEKSSYDNFTSEKYEEAIKDLKELIKMNPALASGYENNIGMCYTELKQYRKALDHFTESLKIDSKNINALSGQTEVYLITEQRDKAIRTLRQILTLYPNSQYAMGKIDSIANLP